ncbi:hypothetical protein JDV02_009896 [Purpureocillium takamizusanense]|uniref:Mannosyl phosphorylinositol ceramide synthase SUR1 n=1 Tax=Purpureocillium takamizusanense TaxID=2060973 RepID=A0A9Q8QSN9_9HYPO|nr:uncharacterized protein JDV02_009896 [Purpureocillium takamizusanense]UNI24121.1 hypothetical protein JDV02_009896 [Purpureocillium takamizusanense]
MVKLQMHDGPAPSSRRRHFLWAAVLIAVTCVFWFRHLLYISWTLTTLRASWRNDADDFILSEAHDNFDVTFTNYTRNQLSAAPYEDVVPPILHHIALGTTKDQWRESWQEAVQSCLDLHPGWKSYQWTDDDAAALVADKFPELRDMWENYRYPIERIDALRYMVLYEYGGVILDMDIKCRSSLGPLRRFGFVAPEAYPTGFSISFMMAAKANAFIGEILRNLPVYDKHWFGLPYATVMFSTGGHFASVVHTNQPDRANFKILPGPLHSLNGRVVTPLFEHLGSSSWHSYDAQLITAVGARANLIFFFCVGMALALFMRRRIIRRLRTM